MRDRADPSTIPAKNSRAKNAGIPITGVPHDHFPDARVVENPLKFPSGARSEWAAIRQEHFNGKLSMSFRKFADVSRHRLLTRAALIGASTVREWSSRNTLAYLRNRVLS